MAKRTTILTDGAILDFVGMLPDPELQARVEKAIRDFYRDDDSAESETPLVRRKRGGKKR